jgi:hypothetical protein
MLRRARRPEPGVSRQTAGWECVHIAIDDCTRLAYAEALRDQNRRTVIGFLRRAVAFYARHGITVERVLTDNGGAYCSTIRAAACRALAVVSGIWRRAEPSRSSVHASPPCSPPDVGRVRMRTPHCG